MNMPHETLGESVDLHYVGQLLIGLAQRQCPPGPNGFVSSMRHQREVLEQARTVAEARRRTATQHHSWSPVHREAVAGAWLRIERELENRIAALP